MKVQTISDLIDWTRMMHHQLAESLADGSTQHEQEMTKLLLAYLADHETALERIIEGFEQQADSKALKTWVYDYLGREPVDIHRSCDAPFAEMNFDEICGRVFNVHNQVIDLYRDLLARADILEAQELLKELLATEEHETMRLAQQTNRMRDM
ncbi:ATPase [Denitrobaculum tricleocarpae]|uniref:ATPase n=1 Tax=Denitrobaculum tricleocarpae TaxID=2591009 RepID=A0A545TTR6_9PROT|nr:ATPase [Denitrobaculum tricleocarpae]TQV80541.1 ATPase [Denitrobaculum tricleocarpae]